MKLRQHPSDKHLTNLHQAYQDFMQAQPWRELTDRNPILLTHPQTGQKALAIVMGHWKTEYGVAMYLDDEGKNEYRRTTLKFTGDRLPHCATTGARNLVDYHQRRRMVQLGIPPYDKTQWPVWFSSENFGSRSTRLIDDDEALFLAHALNAATALAQAHRDGILTLNTDERPRPGLETVTAYRSQKINTSLWTHTQETIAP